jgi:hypothetical protein
MRSHVSFAGGHDAQFERAELSITSDVGVDMDDQAITVGDCRAVREDAECRDLVLAPLQHTLPSAAKRPLIVCIRR